jgi:membrane protein DedA with SNARE-associated domain
MWSLIDSATGAVAVHPGCAVTIAFVAAIIEATAVLGILIPGTPILMAVAAAAAMAGLPTAPIMVVAILGAVIGDGLSFWIGRRFSGRLRCAWPFSTRPGLLCRADAFFRRYGTLSVAICRFVPVLRSTVPLVAGMTNMNRPRFFAANICSALIWAPAHILPARFAGLSLNGFRDGDFRRAAWFAGLMGLCAAAVWGAHHVLRRRARGAPLGPG